jgi:hypothetical protein
MAEYAKPVWSYADSMGPGHPLRAYAGIQRTYPSVQGTSDKWRGQQDNLWVPNWSSTAVACGIAGQ